MAYGGSGNYSLSDAGGTYGAKGSQSRLVVSAPPVFPGGADQTIDSDDQTFENAYGGGREELIDVYAPPGKLGLVIDTPDDGVPAILDRSTKTIYPRAANICLYSTQIK